MISMTAERVGTYPVSGVGLRRSSAVMNTVLVLVLTVGLVGPTRPGTS
ncbi:MAG: hypothetical protein LBT40_09900 [Deltaproteobacteria bacterium]|jgi:hypothetical protein|nr:hypothetical protein [Deltaproteobacteria bacterium]